MKKVAGTLRLDLASYRELESFAQFGSDLDKATLQKLNRGKRTIEVLKQGLHKPITMEKQVMIIYALIHGHLDEIPIEDIRRFEDEFYEYLDAGYPQVLRDIRESGELAADEDMKEAITTFQQQFSRSY